MTRLLEAERAPAASPARALAATRLDDVDCLRGLVMVIMALDHVRGTISNATFDIIDPEQTTPAYFFTRWITHFCAPLFVFLAGTGAYLAGSRGMTRLQLSGFLLSRGLWLVLLELTVVRLVWVFPVAFTEFGGAVIWAIGWSMVCLSVLVLLPYSAIATIGVAIVVLHNASDGVRPEDWGDWGWLWHILHTPGPISIGDKFKFWVGYPVLPWAGVMACGYAFGALVRLPSHVKREQLIGLGLTLTLLFIGLRASNLYGDLQPWSLQERGDLYSFFSFLNCNKYPPSLLFLLMTIGPAIFLLGVMPKTLGPVGRVLTVYGRVPLFYYVIHFFLIRAIAVALALATYGKAGWLFAGSGVPTPPGYGYDLPVVYLIWILLVALLYLPCRWFAGVKKRRRDWWLSYL